MANKAAAQSRILSFVIPARNEEQNLAIAIDSILEQKLPPKTRIEIIIAVAPSEDGTLELADGIAKKNKKVSVIPNPTSITSAGLNLAIEKSRGEVIFRVDGHSKLTPGYVLAALEVLDSDPKIGNVGGIMKAQGTTDFEKAVAWSYSSKFGLGGGAFHTGGTAGPVDTVYLGAFRRELLVALGMFDPKVVRGQDWELNQRIRAAGWLVWFEPKMVAHYKPRSNISDLANQFFKTGKWRGVLSKNDLSNVSVKYLVPPLLVISSVLWFPLWAYLIFVALLSVVADVPADVRFRLLAVIPTIHYSWGVGFLAGLFTKR